MILNIIRFINRVLLYPWRITKKFRQRLFNFIIPNIRALINKRVIYIESPVCKQKVFIIGTGTVEIGSDCSFGYELGGLFRSGSIELQSRSQNAHIRIRKRSVD